ncbi:OpgC protein [Caulifigura coniformis]|uniref:OpgC protein n=1 Tax=Caulifigura coniformis TaxID=2527983 RepID=A0A517SJP8_9PLAN|nr:OpgC domain-containing protein [Caulifigura coniformis]QDT56351.1 OpgC protein [Caulifigura coniformis]
MGPGPATANSSPEPSRLVSLDFLRGLVLTFVLVDHIDDLIADQEFFNRWTLKGLGLSDAAEAFVFLAGFTFGWVFSPRIERLGLLACQRRAMTRSFVIYGAMMATTLLVAALAWSISRTSLVFRLPLTITTPAMFSEAIRETAMLREPVWGVAILVIYIVVLPLLPLFLQLARRTPAAAIGLSLVIYTSSQLSPALSAGDAGFNPLAWQLLVALGVVAGHVAVTRPRMRWNRTFVIGAGVVVIVGMLVARGVSLPALGEFTAWVGQQQRSSPLFSKTNLGLARIIHFAAVAIVTTWAVQRWPSFPETRWARPFVWSGRHSLPLFCLGVILAYVCAIASAFLPSHPVSLFVLAADAFLVQVVAAWFLERRRVRRHALAGTH